jgi:drug/metabolite transporter (DMT)-like permease
MRWFPILICISFLSSIAAADEPTRADRKEATPLELHLTPTSKEVASPAPGLGLMVGGAAGFALSYAVVAGVSISEGTHEPLWAVGAVPVAGPLVLSALLFKSVGPCGECDLPPAAAGFLGGLLLVDALAQVGSITAFTVGAVRHHRGGRLASVSVAPYATASTSGVMAGGRF